jgi:hypothetical protein
MTIPGQERENARRQRENAGRPLSTADIAAGVRRREESHPADRDSNPDDGDITGTYEAPPMSARHESPVEVESRAGEVNRRPDAMSQAADVAQPTAGGPSHARARLEAGGRREVLQPLFTPDQAETFRARWTSIQSSFVDDPRQAVRNGDELVAQIMTNLASTFADERHRVEAELDDTGEAATENLRVALQRYRSFFQRLLSL